MDELNLALSGIEDPVTARVTDLIRLSEALDKTQTEAGRIALEDGLSVVLDDLYHIVHRTAVVQGDNVIPFPGGHDVH